MRWGIGLILLVSWSAGTARADDVRGDLFETQVRPVLVQTCFPCHGGKKTSGKLRVDSRAALLKGGTSGAAVVPGDPEGSLLLQALCYEQSDLKMPPDGKLPAATVEAFQRWVAEGAVWPDGPKSASAFTSGRHWAFEPLGRVEPPREPAGWANGPVDRFVAARWSALGLRPVGMADKRTLLRRVTFDLIGLPPTREEIAGFLEDESPGAFERVVERLLASPSYGERWGRHWLDLARYADTAGDNADYPIPEIALYRDYVIKTFNSDKPYDEFVREQIAGDILAKEGPPEKFTERVVATGFIALSRRYATAPFELMHLTLEDTIDTTGRAFLGLTLRCARCHDHKFDPITTRDYYGLYGIFASTSFPYAGSEEFQSKNTPRQGFVPIVPDSEAGPRTRAYEAELGRLQAEIGQLEASKQDPARLKVLQGSLSTLRRRGHPSDLPVAYAVSETKPIVVPIQRGGDPAQPGAVVPHGVPESLAGTSPPAFRDNVSGRRELAEWIAGRDNPLTARVFVNRVWQHHFGRGLVGTASNFGIRGEEPTHPELLDWLSRRFIESGWSVKALHRLIVLSKTYQLASGSDEGNVVKDPDARFLWRYPRRRLDAEAFRDALLCVSGQLSVTRPSPHPFPAISEWHWTQHSPFKAVYPSRHRTVYVMTQRLQRHPYLALFDGPDTNVSTESRTQSTVPLQALYLLNDRFVFEQAEGFAGRILMHSGNDDERVRFATELSWGRPPRDVELSGMKKFIAACEGAPEWAQLPAEMRERNAWSSLAKVLLTANDFLYVD
ncbi:MAG: PSD1 and planctomycete cytochrome C domain-containing protein [Isosphaeraceae bacterium]|nr:PSD1 and planctomycete cytochrome C domain-containing protein [Isosphaeraceae bacterium]